jgi:PEP-CTERM motif
MRNCCLSLLTVSSLAAIVASAPAHAATELCPGPAVVSGPITNGSTCNLQATGTAVNEVYIGANAKDEDILNNGSKFIFDNTINTQGDAASQAATIGSVQNFNLVNTNDPLNFLFGTGTYNTGTAYTNPAISLISQTALPGVFHFALFDMTSAADFDSVFGPRVTIGSSLDSFFLSHGGYSDWIFVGAEDSRVTESDDWNDTIYAFQNVAPVGSIVSPGVPEPSTWLMMLAGFAGLGFAGYRASRKGAATA